jgi:hypothetical protein
MLVVNTPAGAQIGDQFAVTLALMSAGLEANPADNTYNLNVKVQLPTFLAAVRKLRDVEIFTLNPPEFSPRRFSGLLDPASSIFR